jgi:hypothetical protein
MEDVDIGAANAGPLDTNANLAGSRFGLGAGLQAQGARTFHDEALHVFLRFF